MHDTMKSFRLQPSRAGRGAFALPTFRPWKIALFLGITYLILGISYMIVSGALAAFFATTIDDLKNIEFIKGVGFALASALLFVGVAFFLLRRIAREEQICSHQREALILSENRALTGVLASSVAHDINNILSLFEHAVEELARDTTDPQARAEHVRELQAASDRVRALAGRLLSVSNPDISDRFGPLDLTQTVRETIDLARTHDRVRSRTLTLDADETLHLFGNSILIHQLMLNLIINAADACKHQGHIDVRIRREGARCIIEVHDDGPGIPEEERELIFTPFYSTKRQGKGLGLLSVRSAVEAHHGEIAVTDSPLGGACFRITLPIEETVPPAVVHDPPQGGSHAEVQGHRTV
jgi:signal transduction histidine kinase